MLYLLYHIFYKNKKNPRGVLPRGEKDWCFEKRIQITCPMQEFFAEVWVFSSFARLAFAQAIF